MIVMDVMKVHVLKAVCLCDSVMLRTSDQNVAI